MNAIINLLSNSGYIIVNLRKQGAVYLKRSNRIPMAILGYLTPKEKRAELMCA